VLAIRRPAIEALYRSLHDAGIVHGDLQVRHVRHIYPVHPIDLDASSKSSPDYSAASSPLRLIDFDSARMASASERAQEWQDLMINLDLASARLGLLSKPKSRRSDELE